MRHMRQTKSLKGTYYAKITFIRCLNSCVAAVCENNQPIILKIHQLVFLIKPINHKQSLQTSRFRFSLCSRHRGGKVPPICDALCPISINTALSEKMRSAITGDIQCQRQRGFTSVVFWDALMNIGVTINSPIWAEDTVVKFNFRRKYPGKNR